MEQGWSIDDDQYGEESPADLEFDDQIFDLAFHPQQDFIAAGLITGRVKLYSYNLEANKEIYNFKFHKKACRSIQFSRDGQFLFTASADCTMKAINLNTGQVAFTQEDAHEAPINRMITYLDYMLITGDDDGVVKLWDLRKQTCCFTFHDNEDFIGDIIGVEDKNVAIAAGGDGYLSVFHLRKGALEARSDNLEDELLSLQLIKNGKKVVVGSQDGVLDVWSWGDWGDISDRFPGHPQSIDTMVKIDEDTVATGSSDGLIRVVSIHPNKMLGIIGEHQDFPIERMSLSRDKNYLGSCSHDNNIKFWNVAYLFEKDEEEEDKPDESGKEEQSMVDEPVMKEGKEEKEDSDEDAMAVDEKSNNKNKKKNKKNNVSANMAKTVKPKSNFFSDIL